MVTYIFRATILFNTNIDFTEESKYLHYLSKQ